MQKVGRGDLLDSMSDENSYVKSKVTENFDGSITEEYTYPDGSKKIMELSTEEYIVDGKSVSRNSFTAWIEHLSTSNGSGYSIKRMNVKGTYGVVTASFKVNVTFTSGSTPTITSAYDPGYFAAGPGVSVRITENPTIINSKPSSHANAQARMKLHLSGSWFTGTVVLRFYQDRNYSSATFGIN